MQISILIYATYIALTSAFNLNSYRKTIVQYRQSESYALKKKILIRAGATVASDEQQKSGLGWDSHKAIDEIPQSLVNAIEGNESMRRKFEQLCRNAQNSICAAIEELDGEGTFRTDAWVRESGGGGVSRVLAKGKVFEKAGVNLSVVYGSMPQEALKAATERGVDRAKGMAPGERVPFFCMWSIMCDAS